MDKINKQQLLIKAKELNGKSTREIVGNIKTETKDKGKIGNLIQKYYFDIDVNNKPEPDFLEKYNLPIELKVTPLKKNKNGQFVAKERLVFGMIDYNNFPKDIKNSSFYYKDSDNLIMNYFHDSSLKNKTDYKFIDSWYLTLNDLPKDEYKQIKKDYSEIYNYIADGKAHELSGKSTEILEAARKGQGKGRDYTSQPNSDSMALRRAFAFKSSYMTKLISRFLTNDQENFYNSVKKMSKEIYKIYKKNINIDFSINQNNKKAKNSNFNFQKKILEPQLTEEMNSLIKDNFIKIRTMKLNDKGFVQESLVLSTNYIKTEEILSTEIFEDSRFFTELNKPYIILLFNNEHILKDVLYFENFLSTDLYENALLIWKNTRTEFEKINSHRLTEESINFISMKDNKDFHVRPKAKNGEVKYSKTSITHRAFWLNRNYINKIIKNKSA